MHELAADPKARRGRAADVHVMGHVRDVADAVAINVHGRNDGDVVEVARSAVGIVHQVGIARLHLGGPDLANRQRHDRIHRDQVGGLRERLGDRAQLGVEERAGEVRSGLDVRGVGGAADRDRHLLGGVPQSVADDLEGHRVERKLVRIVVRGVGLLRAGLHCGASHANCRIRRGLPMTRSSISAGRIPSSRIHVRTYLTMCAYPGPP